MKIFDQLFETASPDELSTYQERKLQEVLRYTWATNAFYRQKWEEAGVRIDSINSTEDFSAAIPMVEKLDFIKDQSDHPPFGRRLEHAIALGERLELYTSSGTSGQGVEVHVQTERELAAMDRMYGYGFRWAGLNRGDHVFLTMPVSLRGGGRIELLTGAANGLTVYPVGNYSAQQKLELLDKFKPVSIIASTSYFGHLAAVSPRNPPCPSVKSLLAGMEGAGLSFFRRIEEEWQATAYDRFGCSQLRADFMFSCEHGVGKGQRPGMLHNLDQYIFFEVIDPETGLHVGDGEFGELVITSLYHFDNPVIRCRLRDGAVYRKGHYCQCGRPFHGIEVGTIRRMDDVMKVKGVQIYPQVVDDIVFATTDIEEYQVTVASTKDLSDTVTIKLMPKSGSNINADQVIKQAGESLKVQTGINFKVEIVNDLPRSEYKARRWIDERVRN